MSLDDVKDHIRQKKRKKLELEISNTDATLNSSNENFIQNDRESFPDSQKKKRKHKKSKIAEKNSPDSTNHELKSSETEDHVAEVSHSLTEEKLCTVNRKKKLKKKNKSKASNLAEKNSPDSKGNSTRNQRAILYLQTWKNDKHNWKFEKITQFWLLKNMFDKAMVPQETFKILLEYLIDLKGGSKDFTIEICTGIIKKMEEKSLSDEKDEILELAYERARSILQNLQ